MLLILGVEQKSAAMVLALALLDKEAEMEQTYDRYKGAGKITLGKGEFRVEK